MNGMIRKKSNAGYRTFTALTLAVVMLLAMLMPSIVYASDPLTNHLSGWPQMTDITPVTACLIDADDGGILYSLDRDTKRFPASITKIMTCLLTIENTKMDDVVTMSQEAVDVAIAGNSNCSPTVGEQFTVEQCLYMLMLKSANDVAVQLAIQVADSVSAFADMMNERAAAIGCKNTHFNNPSGLPDEDHWTTAYDMALILRECLKNDTFRVLIATETYTVPPTNMMKDSRVYENHNQLILKSSELYYPNCIGGKTGYTDAAMRTLVCAAKKDGRTLVGVTMGAAERQDFTDMKSLFEYGFNQFEDCQVNDGTYEGVATLPKGMGTNKLTMEDSGLTDDNGKKIMNCVYDGKIKVGEATEIEKTAVSAASDAEETEMDNAGNGGLSSFFDNLFGGKKINKMFVGAVVLALAAVLVLLVVILQAKAEARRREEAKRRAQARRRRERRRDGERNGERNRERE